MVALPRRLGVHRISALRVSAVERQAARAVAGVRAAGSTRCSRSATWKSVPSRNADQRGRRLTAVHTAGTPRHPSSHDRRTLATCQSQSSAKTDRTHSPLHGEHRQSSCRVSQDLATEMRFRGGWTHVTSCVAWATSFKSALPPAVFRVVERTPSTQGDSSLPEKPQLEPRQAANSVLRARGDRALLQLTDKGHLPRARRLSTPTGRLPKMAYSFRICTHHWTHSPPRSLQCSSLPRRSNNPPVCSCRCPANPEGRRKEGLPKESSHTASLHTSRATCTTRSPRNRPSSSADTRCR